jgi:hypothetical protein
MNKSAVDRFIWKLQKSKTSLAKIDELIVKIGTLLLLGTETNKVEYIVSGHCKQFPKGVKVTLITEAKE